MVLPSRLASFAVAGVLAFGAMAARADITVVSWGGAYTLSQQKAYGEGWERKTGKKINWVEYNGDLAEVRAQVEAGEILWDVLDLFAHEGRVGCTEGLFEELPRDVFVPAPNGARMDDELLVALPNNCVVPNIVWSWVTFYDESSFPGEKPKTIADFFDLVKFPGKRAMSIFPQANIEMALVADGVDPKKVYQVMDTPEGVDRAFAKLDSIREHVRFWASGEEPVDLVKNREVVMSTVYSGRVGAAFLEGDTSLRTIWDGQILDEEWFVIVKGSRNFDEALDFLVYASAPEQQAKQAKWITYGPMRLSGFDIIKANEPWFNNGANVMPLMPGREETLARTVISDPDWWAEKGGDIVKRYAAWMGKP